MKRQCGDCQLCCSLLPMSAAANASMQETAQIMLREGMIKDIPLAVADFDKPSGQRCQHQKHGVGCKIYEMRPLGCRFWRCAWLAGADLPRPDHSRYVVDTVLDEVKAGDQIIPSIQVWCDPRTPDAWKDDRLLDFINKKGEQIVVVGVIRYNESEAIVIIPPSVSGAGWIEHRNTSSHKHCDFGIQHHLEQMRQQQ